MVLNVYDKRSFESLYPDGINLTGITGRSHVEIHTPKRCTGLISTRLNAGPIAVSSCRSALRLPGTVLPRAESHERTRVAEQNKWGEQLYDLTVRDLEK